MDRKKINQIIIVLVIISLTAVLSYFFKFRELLDDQKKSVTSSDADQKEPTDLPYTEKIYTLNYEKVDASLIENISVFNKSEIWKGSGFYDYKLFFEYPESLAVTGGDRNKIIVTRKVELRLDKVNNFDLILNLQSDPDDLENGKLIFIDSESRKSQYALSKIQKGWQILKFKKKQFIQDSSFDWKRIKQLEFEFLPRPLGIVVINLGGLRVEADEMPYSDWNITNNNIIIFDKRDNKINLMLRNIDLNPMNITIKKIPAATNFKFQSSFSPLAESWSGLFVRGNYRNGYGYYLMVSGVGDSQWRIYKYNKDGYKFIEHGVIPDFQFKTGEWYYLKVEAEGNKIKTYISVDKEKYIPLGILTDDEFKSGGVGIAVSNGAASLFNDFLFSQD